MNISIGWQHLLAALLLAGCAGAAQANMDIKFSGVLQVQTCSLKNSEVDVQLPDFSVKEFYERTRTPVANFTIELTGCASVKGKTISIRFDGAEENQLPGYLSVEGENRGALGIGIQDTDGRLLKLNAQGQKTRIENDNLMLTYGAFVEATADAIGKKQVKVGNYKAQASFTFDYE
ncbi:fimbrial protein [Serratia marcescens]|uniref:fimbrial protein n=1 Tax=Serratia marcescens TaxID=615 RepID=UPI00148D9A2A|nr:fimbrial protein [Serratia marcescens]QJU42285.1 type 1 fimbrial protein [Serratia marcescens]